MSDLFTVQNAAKILGIRPISFFALLRDRNFLTKANLPRNQHIAHGLFHIKHHPWTHPTQGKKISSRAMITTEGIKYFDRYLKHEAPETLRKRNRQSANEDCAHSSAGKGAESSANTD